MLERTEDQGGPTDLETQRERVGLDERPVLFLDVEALWAHRGELEARVGANAARGLIMGLGFAQGWLAAGAVGRPVEGDNGEGWADALRSVHSRRLFTISELSAGPLSSAGTTLTRSFEAEQQLKAHGPSDAPVCWMICGVMSGYLSRQEDKDVRVQETECIGRGDATCQFRARARQEWGEEPAHDLPPGHPGGADDTGAPTSLPRGLVSSDAGRLGGAPTRVDDHPATTARSPAMIAVLELARRVAVSEATVLISGESGVGKERIARLLHDWSERARGPFVAVNCGAMTEGLLDSELFGHARGAFTGAIRDRPGLFEAAQGGTLLLDEITDISPFMQVKLLRALQEREIRRVGENMSRRIDVRLLGATNRDLAAAVRSGALRSDLYYRLKVVELHVPALRARREDILHLARVLLDRAARRMKRKIDGLSPPATDLVLAHDWPGNVRELENIMERAVALARGDRIEVWDLPDELRETKPEAISPEPCVRPLRAVEKEHILASLELNGGNQTHTAQQLEIGSATLYRKLKSYGALKRQQP